MTDDSQHPFIVVGLDGSSRSIDAARWAIRHARGLGADVRIIGAWFVPSTLYVAPTYLESDFGRSAETSFEQACGKVMAEADEGDVEITATLVHEHPRKALMTAARGAEALVIGTHSRGDHHPEMHLGSTASYLVHHAPCPVIVVPAGRA